MTASALTIAVAVASKPKPALQTMTEPSLAGTAMKMVLVLGVLAAIAWYLRRRAAGGRSRPIAARSGRRVARVGGSSRGALRVVSRQTLGKGACLAVVEWDGREVLVGVTNAGISFYNEASAAALVASEGPEPDGVDAPHGQTPVPACAVDPALRLAASREFDMTHDAPYDARRATDGTSARPTFLDALRDLTVRH